MKSKLEMIDVEKRENRIIDLIHTMPPQWESDWYIRVSGEKDPLLVDTVDLETYAFRTDDDRVWGLYDVEDLTAVGRG